MIEQSLCVICYYLKLRMIYKQTMSDLTTFSVFLVRNNVRYNKFRPYAKDVRNVSYSSLYENCNRSTNVSNIWKDHILRTYYQNFRIFT
jgi:hypothetical protein